MSIQIVLSMIQWIYKKRDVNMIRWVKTFSELKSDIQQFKYSYPGFYRSQLDGICFKRLEENDEKRENFKEGINDGLMVGVIKGRNKAIRKLLKSGYTEEELSKIIKIPVDKLISKEKTEYYYKKDFKYRKKYLMEIAGFTYQEIKANSFDEGLEKSQRYHFIEGQKEIINRLMDSGISKKELEERLNRSIDGILNQLEEGSALDE